MLDNFLKGVAFVVFSVTVMLALAAAFMAIPVVGNANVLGIDLGFVVGVFVAIPLAQSIFRRVSWLRFRGL